MSISAMKQALEFIEKQNEGSSFWLVPGSNLNTVVSALRQAIAEAEKQEPVAQCTYPKCQATSGCIGVCSKTSPVHAIDISQERVDETEKCGHEFEEMVKRGTKAWADTPDDWVDDLRGGAEKQEPVAWMAHTNDITSLFYETRRAVAIKAKLEEKNT
jgi:hypothetical protein